MTVRPSPRLAAILMGYAWGAAGTVLLLGCLTLAGWTFEMDALKRLAYPGSSAMNPMTGAGFVVAGLSLALAINEPKRRSWRWRASLACGLIVILVGVAKYLGMHFGFAADSLLFPARVANNPMAPNTAGGFLCVGLALVLLDRPFRRGHYFPVSFALLTSSVAVLALTGYANGVAWFYQVSGYIPMALNTAIAFLLLGTAILAARPRVEPVATLLSETAGGVVARRLLPAAAGLPFLIGWLCFLGSLHYYNRAFSVTLFSALMTAVFLVLIWWNARSLLKLDVERKRIAEERDRFFTMSADMMCIANFEGYFLRTNPAWDALGYTEAELTSRPWVDFVHPDDVAATKAEGKKLALGAVTLYFDNRYRCKDGSYRWLSWTSVPVVSEQRLYAVARDSTERRAAEEKLRDTNQRLAEVLESELEAQQALRTAQGTLVQSEKLAGLGQMVAGVAHEINNPLSFVGNNVAVLQRDLRGMVKLLDLYSQADDAIGRGNPALLEQIQQVSKEMDFGYTLRNLQDLLERSREGLRRIQQIVRDLRDFARLDESDLTDVNINDGVQSTVNIILGHAKKRGISIKANLAALPKVSCYPAKINQVVMNLLTNAIDASQDNGEVMIRTRRDDDSAVCIDVSDSGSGIDPAIRGKIFDPFFTTKPQGQGTGLGLSISYGIVRDHGGKIEVESEIGQGSTFTVTLPISREGK